MDRLDERLSSTLEQRAGSIAEPLPYLADDIVRMGRRAARRRAWMAAAGGVTALVLAGVPIVLSVAPGQADQPAVGSTAESTAGPAPVVPTNCAVERLALPAGGARTLVMAMAPTGRYVVGRTAHPDSTSDFDLLIWDRGALHRVDLPGEQQIPTDVNAGGVVVGSGNGQAWLYGGGAAVPLPGKRSSAAAISDGGVIVGSDDGLPVLWRSASGAPAALPLPEGTWEGQATDITADGRTIVGTIRDTKTNTSHAYVWSTDGTRRELPLPVTDGVPAAGAHAAGITGDWVSGAAETQHTSVVARWNLRTGEVQTLPDAHGAGGEISADGWMVASDRFGNGTLLLSRQATLRLPGLPDHDDARIADVPKSISQDGLLIAGNAASAAAKDTLPVLWRCT
ncbi:hypothetical protein ACFO1B_08265 [Dactylosporangium siamense]|uniref:Uncharacterized protein n=1 Tax=Dactylosporangium siamense TaxID=685454 RepID=A0A919PQ49_9ACTN|nr:hypothetical protein [Dactylosporangium siamense]GIG48019.1 hypothetical protein Dsi01nite_060600 [Dactylosporangium siamense]